MTTNRKETPDILGNLMLNSLNENNKKIKPDINKEINTVNNLQDESNKAITPAISRALNTVNSQAINTAKEKATFNLSCETLEMLEDAWLVMRKNAKLRSDRITKTDIVEIAIKMACGEFEKKGELSELYRNLKS